MRNDGEVATATKPVLVDIDSGLLDSGKLGVDEGISDFLAKPQLITSGTWGSSPSLTLLDAFAPFDLLNSVGVWRSKLLGFRYFRGTAVVTVMVNAQKF